MHTNISAVKRLWTEGAIEREPHIGIKSWHQHRYRLKHDLWNPLDWTEADRVTQTLSTPHLSDSHIPHPTLNKTPTREEVKEMIKRIPSDKAVHRPRWHHKWKSASQRRTNHWHDLPLRAHHWYGKCKHIQGPERLPSCNPSTKEVVKTDTRLCLTEAFTYSTPSHNSLKVSLIDVAFITS